jgi:hypothetical protein
MEGLVTHETSNGGLANLLGNYDNVPVVEFVGDVLNGILAAIIAPVHETKIFLIQPDINLSEAIHYFSETIYLRL